MNNWNETIVVAANLIKTRVEFIRVFARKYFAVADVSPAPNRSRDFDRATPASGA